MSALPEDEEAPAALLALETRLLDPAVRADRSALEPLFADDFVEFGASGRIYDKTAILDALTASPQFESVRTVEHFTARTLGAGVVLVTYRIPQSSTLRSSIWRRDGDRWVLVFHQATKV